MGKYNKLKIIMFYTLYAEGKSGPEVWEEAVGTNYLFMFALCSAAPDYNLFSFSACR